MERFFAGLTPEDWAEMTDAEWRATIQGTFESKDDVIDFIHYFNEKDMLWVVTEMASHFTKKEIKIFYDSFHKKEYDLLSEKEWIAFKKGADKVQKGGKMDKMMKYFFGEPDHERKEREKHER